jgi:RNA methyltransferase, TrmH family
MPLITSPSNPRISKLKALHTARGRKQSGLFLMEGPHLLEVLLNTQMLPHEVYYQPVLLQRTAKGKQLLARLLQNSSLSLIEVSERVIEAIGDVQASQGVISVLPLDAFSPAQVRKRRPATRRPALLILDDLADPGNMGTLLRTALAADVEAVLLTPNCVDCYNPKVVRSAAGAHVGLPIETDMSWQTIAERIAAHCQAVQRVLLAEAGSEHVYYEQDLTVPFALIIGNEAHGPSTAAQMLATLTISIPLCNGVESLNAAMAGGILLYEALRQRQITTGYSSREAIPPIAPGT